MGTRRHVRGRASRRGGRIAAPAPRSGRAHRAWPRVVSPRRSVAAAGSTRRAKCASSRRASACRSSSVRSCSRRSNSRSPWPRTAMARSIRRSGADLEARGFNEEYRTGASVHSGVAPDASVSYRDVVLDPEQRDDHAAPPAAARSRRRRQGPRRRSREPRARAARGLRDRRRRRSFLLRTQRRRRAVGDRDSPSTRGRASCSTRCGSRTAPSARPATTRGETSDGHHLLDARTRRSASAIASLTVIAPTAMVADALGTAAFALGPEDGVRFLERHGVDGFGVTPALERFGTAHSHRVVLSHA